MAAEIELLLEWLNDNDPPIEGVRIELWELRATDHAIVRFEHYGQHDFYPCTRPLHYRIRYIFTYVWRCLGQAIGKSETIQSFSLHYMRNEFDALEPEPLPSSLLQSINALQSGLRENKSIQSFAFSQSHVIAGTNLPMFDFNYFLKNNEMLDDIHLGINEDLTWDQACMIEAAIKEKTLKRFKLQSFEENQFFRQILMSCFNVECLIVSCEMTQQCEAIAEFISHPEIATTSLAVIASELMSDSQVELLKAALIQNKTLTKLNVDDISTLCRDPPTYTADWGSILCDASSIENILYASNHVLQEIIGCGIELSERDLVCLDMNEQLSPEQAAREKIFWYYFVGNFSIEPFVDMPASVVVEVMGMIEIGSEDEFDPNAFFRLLKCRPDLCSFARSKQEGGEAMCQLA